MSENGMHVILAGLGLAVLAMAAAPAAAGGLKDLKVTTDRSIDCSSIETIARDLYRDCKTDEQKAIATWYFVRRMLFHWPITPTWDSLEAINSYCFGLCGPQSTAFCRICDAGGIKARKVKAGPHMMAEAFYGDAWHLFDCQVGWYALRKDKSAVASAAEMKADNSIVTDAVKDGRASAPFFQCSDKPDYGVQAVNTHYIEGPASPLNYRLILNLRRGESITRCWSNEGKPWRPNADAKWAFPSHGCTRQTVDANDPVNWPYWKPYAQIESVEGSKIKYGYKRYYGNGRMVYSPNLATDGFRDGLAPGGAVNLHARCDGGDGPNLHPAAAGKPASVTFTMACPYLLVDAWLDAEGVRKGDKDVLAVSIRGKKGQWQEVYRASETGKVELKAVSLKDAAFDTHGFQVRFDLAAGADPADAGLDKLTITTVFMNNMYALPYLLPGENTIRVTAAEGADAKASPVTLEYQWTEQGKDKSLVRRIESLPFEEKVAVGGTELPRMKSVTLSVAP